MSGFLLRILQCEESKNWEDPNLTCGLGLRVASKFYCLLKRSNLWTRTKRGAFGTQQLCQRQGNVYLACWQKKKLIWAARDAIKSIVAKKRGARPAVWPVAQPVFLLPSTFVGSIWLEGIGNGGMPWEGSNDTFCARHGHIDLASWNVRLIRIGYVDSFYPPAIFKQTSPFT